MKVLIYEELNELISIVIPFSNELTLLQIGEKDIPNNIPFWVINYEDLPDTPQETWELQNMGEPDGYGKKI